MSLFMIPIIDTAMRKCIACGLALLVMRAYGAIAAVYVDSCATTPGTGSVSDPYKTMAVAILAAAPGSTLVVRAGSYPESLRIEQKLTISASGGPVLLGGQFVGTMEVCVPVNVTDDSCAWASVIPISVFCSDNPPGARARIYYPAAGPGDP